MSNGLGDVVLVLLKLKGVVLNTGLVIKFLAHRSCQMAIAPEALICNVYKCRQTSISESSWIYPWQADVSRADELARTDG